LQQAEEEEDKKKERKDVSLKQMLYAFAPQEFSIYSKSIEMFKLNWNR
jgi:hypothetical protein